MGTGKAGNYSSAPGQSSPCGSPCPELIPRYTNSVKPAVSQQVRQIASNDSKAAKETPSYFEQLTFRLSKIDPLETASSPASSFEEHGAKTLTQFPHCRSPIVIYAADRLPPSQTVSGSG